MLTTELDGLDYTELWNRRLDEDSVLRKLIVDDVLSYCADSNEEGIEQIHKLLTKLFTTGLPLPYIADVLSGGSGEDPISPLLCSGCEARCCTESATVGLEFTDIRALAKREGIPWKRYMKERTTFISAAHADMIEETYGKGVRGGTLRFKAAEPCEYIKDGRCAVYDVRPTACRIYPLLMNPETREYEFQVFPICRYVFNAIIVEVVGRLHPQFLKVQEPWMKFINLRSRYPYTDDGFNKDDPQYKQINAIIQGNKRIWQFVVTGELPPVRQE